MVPMKLFHLLQVGDFGCRLKVMEHVMTIAAGLLLACMVALVIVIWCGEDY